MKHVVIVRKGDFSIQTYNLASGLAGRQLKVTALLSMTLAEEDISRELLQKIGGQVAIIRQQDIPQKWYWRGRSILGKLGRTSRHLIVNPLFTLRTRRRFQKSGFDQIIAVGPESLYWAWYGFPADRGKIIYYNLEVIYKGHPLTRTDRLWARIVDFERAVFNSIGGIMIQDKFRGDALVNGVPGFNRNKLLFHPVCIAEGQIIEKNGYLRAKFSLPPSQVIVLYFGGLFQGRFLEDIIRAARGLQENMTVVIHGGKGGESLDAENRNVIVSTERLPYSQITKLIASADIGLAFYLQDNYNDAFTAWSSEKISRYCQCGVPFIAFENENYLHFKKSYDCCVLIQDMSQLGEAIAAIMTDYEYYRQNAWRAFKEQFDNESQVRAIVNFIDKID